MASWNERTEEEKDQNIIDLLFDLILPFITAVWIMFLCAGSLALISAIFKLLGR